MAFDPISVTGYNSNPPDDDGTEAPSNEVTWVGIKGKLADPLKTAFDDLVTELTASFDELFDILMAPSGTRMLFHNTTPPTGWTKDTSRNDKALRVVSGTVGADGGSTAFSTVFASRIIAEANLPASITHSLSVGTTITNGTSVPKTFNTNEVDDAGGAQTAVLQSVNTSATLSLASGAVSGTIGGSGTAMDFAVQRVDVTIAEKD